MNVDFSDAHSRHWEDAEHLFGALRFANADHLYGLAAECGLKRLMLQFGMPLKNGVPGKNDRVHADGIWDRYEAYRSGKAEGVDYALPAPSPFVDWNVNQRYAHRSDFSEGRVDPHRRGAKLVRNLIKKATVEGLLV
ncbi:MAG: SAM-dependent methyltransferase [Acidiferrobacter sp.]